jgi:hypothetical protein
MCKFYYFLFSASNARSNDHLTLHSVSLAFSASLSHPMLIINGFRRRVLCWYSSARSGTIGGEEKEMFLRFMGRMLQWNPSKRRTTKKLAENEWL